MSSTAKKIIIYAYRLTDDTGCAPCIFDRDGNPTGTLSLACCKGGQIRNEGKHNEREIRTGLRHAIGSEHKQQIANGQVTVYVLGIYKDTLLYFAEITEIITMTDYFAPGSPYKNRLDNIYDTLPKGFNRNDNNPAFHPKADTGRHKRDWLGVYALLSNIFAYFGRDSKAIPPNLLRFLPKGQETKHYDGDSSEGKQILDEVRKHWNFKDVIQGTPHDYNGGCGHKGCGTK